MNIVYQGNVNFRLKLKDKIYDISTHNEGMPALFKAISMALAGYNIKEYLPTYIRVLDSNDDSKSKKDITVSGRAFNYDSDTNQWCTKFTANIPYNVVDGGLTSSDKIAIYAPHINVNDNDIEKLAVVNITDSSIISAFQQGTELIVEWKMYTDNPA